MNNLIYFQLGASQLGDLSSPTGKVSFFKKNVTNLIIPQFLGLGGHMNDDGIEVSKPTWDRSLPKWTFRWIKKKIKLAMGEFKVWLYLICLGMLTAIMGWLLGIM